MNEAMPSAEDASFKRGQVEHALYRLFATGRAAQGPVPRAFLNRIKKLLDLDRAGPIDNSGPMAAPFAFAAEDVAFKQGVDAEFSAFDAACLAYALDMTESGYKPKEIVYLLRHIRGSLHDAYDDMVERGLHPRRSRMDPRAFPELPVTTSAAGVESADPRLFLLVQRVDLSTAHAEVTGTPLFLTPKLCRGLSGLAQALAGMGAQRRHAFVLELAWSAQLLRQHLQAAPRIPRGVKS